MSVDSPGVQLREESRVFLKHEGLYKSDGIWLKCAFCFCDSGFPDEAGTVPLGTFFEGLGPDPQKGVQNLEGMKW